MTAKAKAPAKKVEIGCTPKVISESERVPLKDISIADGSGWRAIHTTSVHEKVRSFLKDGNFNCGVMSKVKLLQQDGAWARVADGLIKIGDGRKTVAALQEIKVIWDDDATRDAETWTDALITVMEEGLDVTVLEFPYNDQKQILAYYVVAHEESTNTLQKTSVKNMADLANEFKKSQVGSQIMLP